jgi:hypothetical protein
LDHEREDDLVGWDKIRKPGLWLKGVALANSDAMVLHVMNFHSISFVYGCLIPTQGEIQIILLLDAKMHLVLLLD